MPAAFCRPRQLKLRQSRAVLFALYRKRRNTFLRRRFDLCCRPRRRFGRKQRPKLPQGCKVFWDQLLVLNPITEFIFQKCHQTDQTERVNLQRLVRISYWWQRTAIVIYVLFEFRWYLHKDYIGPEAGLLPSSFCEHLCISCRMNYRQQFTKQPHFIDRPSSAPSSRREN